VLAFDIIYVVELWTPSWWWFGMRPNELAELKRQNCKDEICCTSQVQLRTERELDVHIPLCGVVGTPPSSGVLALKGRRVGGQDGFGMR
jgi:hypothetical protein